MTRRDAMTSVVVLEAISCAGVGVAAASIWGLALRARARRQETRRA